MLNSKIYKTENVKSRFLSGKTIKITILVLALCVMNQYTNAQCNNNKVLMNKCVSPYHPINCKERCANPSQVQNLLANGWHYGSCYTTPCYSSYRLEEEVAANEISIISIYPNPVSNSTNISFFLPQSQKASLKIFDLNGRLVSTLADKNLEAGENEIVWNAADVNAGVYFLQFQSAENLQTEILIVTK